MNFIKSNRFITLLSVISICVAVSFLAPSTAAESTKSKSASKNAKSEKSDSEKSTDLSEDSKDSTNKSYSIIGSAADSDFYLSATDASEKKFKLAVRMLKSKLVKLDKMLSLSNPESEISRFAKSTGKKFKASLGFTIFLKTAERYRVESQGKFNINTGALISAWEDAAKSNKKPSQKVLKKLIKQYQKPAFKIDSLRSEITPTQNINIRNSAFIRAYIASKLASLAQRYLKDAANFNISTASKKACQSTLYCTSSSKKSTQKKDIEIPIFYCPGATDKIKKNKPITIAKLNKKSIAFGLAQAGSLKINSKEYALIANPTTGELTSKINLIAVVDKDIRSASAWSQVLAVMSPKSAISLAKSKEITVLIIGANNKLYKNDPDNVFIKIDFVQDRDEEQATSSALPKSAGIKLKFDVIKPKDVKKYRYPTLAIWIETQNGAPIKTLKVWKNGTDAHLFKLKDWMSHGKSFVESAKKITEASKGTGSYTVFWDGTNNKGRKMPPGKYKICIEIFRPAGKKCETDNYQKIVKVFSLTGKKFSEKLDDSDETNQTSIESVQK